MDSHKYFEIPNGLYIIYAFAILFVFWLLLRGLRNWYWRHNEMISLMQEISEKLTRLDNSINKQNNNVGKGEIHESKNTTIEVDNVEEKTIIKKPKESIWTKKIF